MLLTTHCCSAVYETLAQYLLNMKTFELLTGNSENKILKSRIYLQHHVDKVSKL
jgi:hypothetical protein